MWLPVLLELKCLQQWSTVAGMTTWKPCSNEFEMHMPLYHTKRSVWLNHHVLGAKCSLHTSILLLSHQFYRWVSWTQRNKPTYPVSTSWWLHGTNYNVQWYLSFLFPWAHCQIILLALSHIQWPNTANSSQGNEGGRIFCHSQP